MSVFTKRVAFKPFEYPDVIQYLDAINHSYWLVSEWNFIGDVQDFNVKLSADEKLVLKNSLLAISQIEVSVKKFWAKLGDRFPKAEFDQVGITFGESEIRHANAYSRLLEVLGFNDDFATLLDNPVMQGRVEYLTKYIKNAYDNDNENYTLTLTLFALFVENVSLFSQFLIVKSFNKYKNWLKDIDNVIQATAREEVVHALFGAKLIEIIKKENPSWFNDEFYGRIYRACRKAYKAEIAIIDWIFGAGHFSLLSKPVVDEFIKDRFNKSLAMIGGEDIFKVDQTLLDTIRWFDEDIMSEISTDFFHKKPVSYSKKIQSIKSDDLF